MREGRKRATPRDVQVGGVRVSAFSRRDIQSVHDNRDNFERGTRWAGIALVLMFAFLSVGCVAGAW